MARGFPGFLFYLHICTNTAIRFFSGMNQAFLLSSASCRDCLNTRLSGFDQALPACICISARWRICSLSTTNNVVGAGIGLDLLLFNGNQSMDDAAVFADPVFAGLKSGLFKGYSLSRTFWVFGIPIFTGICSTDLALPQGRTGQR
jgi:hypothetical protein